MTQILTGKPVAQAINDQSRELIHAHDLTPMMKLILVGNDPASMYYVNSIVKQGTKLGIQVECLTLADTVMQDELAGIIIDANNDLQVDGIMLQRPLPSGINARYIEGLISPEKDIDGIHPLNLGKIITEEPCFVPCTAMAVVRLMEFYQIDPAGKHVVILGRSTVVGKPLAMLLLQKQNGSNGTVTVCHSRTADLIRHTVQADILIAAIGKTEYVSAAMIKKDAVLIDVGINKKTKPDGSVTYVGDIDCNDCLDSALAITPVPGGVGSVTTAVLFSNLVQACLSRCV